MRHRRVTPFLVLILVVGVLAGCAAVQDFFGKKSVGHTLIVSGESLVFTSKQFEIAGKEFTARCAESAGAKRLSKDTCNAFDTFGQKFKEAWPHVTAAWRTAVKFRDATLQGDMQKALSDLAAQLFVYLGQIGLSQADSLAVIASLFQDGDSQLRDAVVASLAAGVEGKASAALSDIDRSDALRASARRGWDAARWNALHDHYRPSTTAKGD